MRITLGEEAYLSTTLANHAGTPTDDSSLELLLTGPNGTEVTLTQSSAVAHDSTGKYHAAYLPTVLGNWRWRWVTTSVLLGADEGTFDVVSIYDGAVTDIRDLRVLIPACRRAIDGPQATAPDAPSTTLADNEIVGMIADATAALILNTQGSESFGYQLLATARDPFYKAPVAWATDKERAPAADAAILSQAALDHYFWLVKSLKVSETAKNEAVEWQYSLSANVIGAWIAYLIANRDKAIAALQVINVPMDSYISLVAERDRIAAAWLEPWVTEIGAPVPYAGGGGSGPLEYDYRFNTWG